MFKYQKIPYNIMPIFRRHNTPLPAHPPAPPPVHFAVQNNRDVEAMARKLPEWNLDQDVARLVAKAHIADEAKDPVKWDFLNQIIDRLSLTPAPAGQAPAERAQALTQQITKLEQHLEQNPNDFYRDALKRMNEELKKINDTQNPPAPPNYKVKQGEFELFLKRVLGYDDKTIGWLRFRSYEPLRDFLVGKGDPSIWLDFTKTIEGETFDRFLKAKGSTALREFKEKADKLRKADAQALRQGQGGQP